MSEALCVTPAGSCLSLLKLARGVGLRNDEKWSKGILEGEWPRGFRCQLEEENVQNS